MRRFIAGQFLLIVDDAPSVLAATSAALTPCCPTATVAFSSSVRALAYCEEHEPSLAVLDVSMPVLNGIALAQRLRARYPALPIVFLTGSTATLAAAGGTFEPPVHVLRKPCGAADLRSAVRAAMANPD